LLETPQIFLKSDNPRVRAYLDTLEIRGET
jgi:hypothetical protein